ncbi:centrosomal protein of 192 kDa isoform X4 [Oryzias latipes]
MGYQQEDVLSRWNMADPGPHGLDDEAFPGFLAQSLDGSGGRPTLGNVSLGSGPGLPVAASTVAKVRAGCGNRGQEEPSFLGGRELQDAGSHSSMEDQPRFALSFKDDLDTAADFIAAHRLSDVLLKVSLDETKRSTLGLGAVQAGGECGWPTELRTADLSTGLLTMTQFGQKDGADTKRPSFGGPAATMAVDPVQSEGVDSDCFSSNSSFLANEKLMSVDSLSSNETDDDVDLNNLPEDELEVYFNQLIPLSMQRGRVEGQEIPVAGGVGAAADESDSSSVEGEQYRHPFVDGHDQDFQMPNVRLAATGMDSCPASDEDTDDELESARRSGSSSRARLLPSTSRQLVGESHRPSFRPGLEGGSSDEEASSGRAAPSLSAIEHRRSAEGQVINPPMTGNGGGGDGSSGSEESGNDGGVSTVPLSGVQTTYDAFRGLGIVGGGPAGGDENAVLNRHAQMGDRVGPVGTGEASSSGGSERRSVSVSGADQQEALVLTPDHGDFEDEGVDEPDGARPSLGSRGGARGVTVETSATASDGTSEDDGAPPSTSLEPKYFSQSFIEDQEESDECWSHCPDDLELEFQQGANATHDIVYQNEEGQWVTDLAYYSCLKKEADGEMLENSDLFQSEDFLPASAALEKIGKDEEEFEKEHQFMQEEQIGAAGSNSTFHGDSSWRIPPTSHIHMRASQVSSDFQQTDESYLRLSLGQFFGQRSEAMGCLGSDDVDNVKRPSFGYIITSPEKREPFALISPSELRSAGGSPHSDDEDRTLNPDELDNTLNAHKERISLQEAAEPAEHEVTPALAEDGRGSGAVPSPGNQSCASPGNEGSLQMLSISTIASAITNASISTDPSQLAAMILDLSKRSRTKRLPVSAGSSSEDCSAAQHILSEADQRAFMETLQGSICVGDLTEFDIEKYLKNTNVSASSDSSDAQTTLDPSVWSQCLSSSQKNLLVGRPTKQHSGSQQTLSNAKPADRKKRADASSRPSSVLLSDELPSANRGDPKRSVGPLASLRHSPSKLGYPADLWTCGSADLTPAGTLESENKSPKRTFSESPHQRETSLPESHPNWKKGEPGHSLPQGSPCSTQQIPGRSRDSPEEKHAASLAAAAVPQTSAEEHGSCSAQKPPAELAKGFSEQRVEESQCNFRPSTSPLTHSSPSQTSIPNADSMTSPPAKRGPAERQPDLSPQSVCSSPSLSRLTYISVNDSTAEPTPEKKNNSTMALSTTIVRSSPTPPLEPETHPDLNPPGVDNIQPQHSKSLDPLPAQQHRGAEPPRSASVLSCTRSQSECSCRRAADSSTGCRSHKHPPDSNAGQLTKVDSGYCSNLNVQQSSSSGAPLSFQQWPASVPALACADALGLPPSYTAEGLHYVPIPSFKPQFPGMVEHSHKADLQSLLSGRSLLSSQLSQHFLRAGPGAFPVGPAGNPLYSIPSTGIQNSDGLRGAPHLSTIHATAGPAGTGGQQELGMMGKPCSQFRRELPAESSLEELRGQVVVPEELRFPYACCVGIAAQTSLSLFNPSERWQQVSITVSSLAIDGQKVDSLPYQWLMVKNKTIIAPKTTEEQKVLFIPPRAGVYQSVLRVCSWPVSADVELAARANIFAQSVLLVAEAENPVIEVETSNTGSLDFGDLPGGSAKSLPLRLLNRTRATVPIRLVISANATAWRCFSFSKHPLTTSSEPAPGPTTSLPAPSVMNHVMHASYRENLDSFMVWVHFNSPQKYTSSSGDLGPAQEYCARVDIEVDSPGPSQVIRSIPLQARSGTARVHAPKGLQTVRLCAPAGDCRQQMLPLKNAGNIDVQLKLKQTGEDGFTVTPDELSLRVGEEKSVVVTFKAQHGWKYRDGLLTVLILPSGPQYEVTLKGEVTPSAPAHAAVLTTNVPPILSNKQFVAWGGVTLGRAVQQKLVLRNNSPKATQQLRLLIRGQDQDCFQLQSLFSPEERLTRHGELSIHPREDVTIHLLFAPTRVACMLAKLEIKQSGVRASQPGVKFTIPLSGYGGTSNIILEEQRKQADGYVATLTDVAAGHVSKVCLSVRNTGSRAAFIKAVAFSDLTTRTPMEPTVLSLAPSQFILKERTQEVITALMKSTQREQRLSHSDNTPLATICLFCGDEVSRQQYRRSLQSQLEAAGKVLSDNSLLRNINFNETFLGEETVSETYDLPQRPNEAHLFYSSMSRVPVSLLGRPRCAEDNQPPTTLCSGAESGVSNVSLDVLPVKGPQGPALTVSTPEVSEPPVPDAWTIHPQHLILPAPTINGPPSTRQVQIQNKSSRELNFDLSWPAHCLTVTPQHGLIQPQGHLQILISPNPSLASRAALLPWSGQIYVGSGGQQKFIKVQIRKDLALDASVTPADKTLSALLAQSATPVAPPSTQSTLTSHSSQTHTALVEIPNKTVVFPATLTGETTETQLEVQNRDVEVRWYLSSFAPPYVKGVDDSEDVYRATYTAFRCSRVSGTLGAREKTQIPVTFLPRDKGDYVQFWDLECHPVCQPQQKTTIRFQLSGTGVKLGGGEGPQEGDCSLVKTDAAVKSRKRPEACRSSPEDALRRGVYSPQELYTFPDTRVGGSSTLKVNVRNNSPETHELNFVKPREPFHIKHSRYSLRDQHYLKLPVQFKPRASGRHTAVLLIQSQTSGSLVIQLAGQALP